MTGKAWHMYDKSCISCQFYPVETSKSTQTMLNSNWNHPETFDLPGPNTGNVFGPAVDKWNNHFKRVIVNISWI